MSPLIASLAFPHFDPVALRLGPIAIRWYGLAYLAGFVVGYLMLRRRAAAGLLPLEAKHVGDLVTWLAIGVIAGGRLGWWMIYHRVGPDPEPWYGPLALWHGGMSFHGGLAGVAVAAMLFCRSRRVPLLAVADALALAAPAGLFFGRLANFVNAELVGRATSVPWGVVFPGDTVARHPSQLYEAALEGPILFAIVWWTSRAFPRRGAPTAAFLVAYGVARVAVEFTREPDAQIGFLAFGWLTMGQALSVLLIAAGSVVAAVGRARARPVLDGPAAPGT